MCIYTARSPTARLGTDIGETPQACRPASLAATVANNERPCFKHGGMQVPTPQVDLCPLQVQCCIYIPILPHRHIQDTS